MRRWRRLARVAVAPVAVIGLIAAGVALAPTALAASGPYTFCDRLSYNLCMTGYSGNIYTEAHTGGVNQMVDIDPVYWCENGDHVTNTCPFTEGSGDNTALRGDKIVIIFFTNHKYDAVVNNSTLDMEPGTGSSDSSVWVEYPCSAVPGFSNCDGQVFINVWATDHNYAETGAKKQPCAAFDQGAKGIQIPVDDCNSLSIVPANAMWEYTN
jgi:hypothetical protein